MKKYDKKLKLNNQESSFIGRFLYLYNTFSNKKVMACNRGYKDLVLEYNTKSLFYKTLLTEFINELSEKYNLNNIDIDSVYLNIEESEMYYNETK